MPFAIFAIAQASEAASTASVSDLRDICAPSLSEYVFNLFQNLRSSKEEVLALERLPVRFHCRFS